MRILRRTMQKKTSIREHMQKRQKERKIRLIEISNRRRVASDPNTRRKFLWSIVNRKLKQRSD